MEIKNINDGINWQTIPKAIKGEFAKNGHRKAETHIRNIKGAMDVTYGEIMRPLFIHYKDDINFYLNEKFMEHFYSLLDNGFVFDEDLNIISYENLKPFLAEYSKGFKTGYNSFEDKVKNENPLFGISNEQMAYKVYSRIVTDKKGSFPMYITPDFKQTVSEKKMRKEMGLKLLFKLNKKSFFNSGFEGGEFYKAWEIILNNPTVFESVFMKYSEVKTKMTQLPEHPNNPNPPTDKNTPFKFENIFDHVPPKRVYDYFKKELVDTNYLSLEDLEKYLIVAFQNKVVPVEKFTITYNQNPAPTKIKKIFYRYYNEIAQDKHGNLKKYCGLLGEYFNGFDTEKLSRNFNR